MPEFKTLNNQLGETVYKELEKHIRKGSKVSTISAYFTMYAYSALKKELDKIDEMRFIFTTPSFSKNKDKEAREYEIVNNNIFGNEFELKLKLNELQEIFDEAWSEVKIPSYTVTKADTFKKLILAFNGGDLNEIH